MNNNIENKNTETTEQTETLHIPSREEFHRRFGGYVYESDFSEIRNMSEIADRIVSDHKFDSYCKYCIKQTDRQKEYEDKYGKPKRKWNGK